MINLYLDPDGKKIFTHETGRDVTNTPNGLTTVNQPAVSESETINNLRERIKQLESKQLESKQNQES